MAKVTPGLWMLTMSGAVAIHGNDLLRFIETPCRDS
jgi:hypothetical protein